MYESSCSYQSALDLKRTSTSPSNSIIKSEDFNFAQNPSEWNAYGFHQSTFERLKQSVEKAKAALQDRTTFLGTSSAFSELYSAQRSNDSTDISLNIQNNNNNTISINSSPLANANSQNSLNNHPNNGSNNNNGLSTTSNSSNGNQRLLHSQQQQQQDSSQDLSKHRQQSKFFASLKIFPFFVCSLQLPLFTFFHGCRMSTVFIFSLLDLALVIIEPKDDDDDVEETFFLLFLIISVFWCIQSFL